MKKIIFLLALCGTLSSFAQNYKFGKVSKQELEEKVYSLDSLASAAYLYSYRRTYFSYDSNQGFQVITEIHQRIKIYSKEGFDKANISIPYYSPSSGEQEVISALKAYTFNLENGKIVKEKLPKKAIFKEKRSKYTSVKKIAMPSIKEGTIIEIKYSRIFPSYYDIRDLMFQYDIPVKKLNVKVEIPEYFVFNKQAKGYYFPPMKESQFNKSIFASGTNNPTSRVDVYSFSVNDIPAIKDDEPFVANINNYRGGLKFELSGTRFPNSAFKNYSTNWNDVCKQIYKSSSFGGQVSKTEYFKNDLPAVIAGASTKSEKLLAVYQYVKTKVKWDDYYGKYTDVGVKDAYKKGIGNVAEINLMLTSMLQSAGLDANPVLVSTKANGIPLFPTLDGFNYVICAVNIDESYVLLDASERYSLPNMLPPRAINWKGRIIFKNGNSDWIGLETGIQSIEDNYISVKFDDEFMAEGMMRNKFDNLGALEYRKKYNRREEESLIENLESAYNMEIENYKVSNKYDLGKAVTRTIKFASDNLAEEISGKLYIKPLLFNGYTSNPFKLKERKFPVDFSSPWKEKNTITIQIPEGYTIETIPETKAIALPDELGVFKYQVTGQGNKIKVVSLVQFNTSVITPSYYESLKEFFKELVEKQSEKIVLVKS